MSVLALAIVLAAPSPFWFVKGEGCRGGGQLPLPPSAVAAELIQRQQTGDGAITMGLVGRDESTVNPYFGCFAAEGLLAEYRSTRDAALLRSALAWGDWYAAHQNPNGTIFDYKGHAGAWRSTAHYDSSDSYAAVYVSFLLDLYRASRDKVWLRGKQASIRLALAGIRLTMQPNGLTLAKPTYPVMYVMDNTETLQGLRSAHELAIALRDTAEGRRTQAEADRMEAAIDSLLWDLSGSSYYIGIQTDGGKSTGLKDWYPDIMANLMAIAWLPPSARNQALFGRVFAKFGAAIPTQVNSQDDLEKLIWWGYAAQKVGRSDLLARIRNGLSTFERICANGCDAGDLGHVVRLTLAR